MQRYPQRHCSKSCKPRLLNELASMLDALIVFDRGLQESCSQLAAAIVRLSLSRRIVDDRPDMSTASEKIFTAVATSLPPSSRIAA